MPRAMSRTWFNVSDDQFKAIEVPIAVHNIRIGALLRQPQASTDATEEPTCTLFRNLKSPKFWSTRGS